MIRTLENCKIIHYYGTPAQNNGVCEGVIRKGSLLEKCQRCNLHDANNALKVCVVCGKEFYSTNPKSKVCCEECRIIRKNEVKKNKKAVAPKKTLDEVLADLNEYNRTHGTHLTYGKYKEMLFMEALKNEKNRK